MDINPFWRSAMTAQVEITIKEQLDPHWSVWFAGLQLTHLPGGKTMIAGLLPDQTALHGLLARIRDLNLTLVAVTCSSPPICTKDRSKS
jgi:hypothetical protein